MRPPIAITKLTDTLTLSECHAMADYRGPYWLYDSTRGMNLAMGVNTPQDALVKALTYYQKRLLEVEAKYSDIDGKVNAFISQFIEQENMED